MEKDHALHDNVRLSNEVEHLSALVSLPAFRASPSLRSAR